MFAREHDVRVLMSQRGAEQCVGIVLAATGQITVERVEIVLRATHGQGRRIELVPLSEPIRRVHADREHRAARRA
jgi:hypothetical protein